MNLSLLLATLLAGALASSLTFRVEVLGMLFGPYDTLIPAGGCLALAAGIYARAQIRRSPRIG